MALNYLPDVDFWEVTSFVKRQGGSIPTSGSAEWPSGPGQLAHNQTIVGSNPSSAMPLKRRWRRTRPVPVRVPFKSVEGLYRSMVYCKHNEEWTLRNGGGSNRLPR